MAKDPTETVAAGLYANVWLAAVGATEPATWDAAFDEDDWFNLGYLGDPPETAKERTTNPVLPWNAPEAIRNLLDTERNTMVLKPMQANAETFELYFGPITIEDEGTGVSITPNPLGDDPERALCLEVNDGSTVVRFYWRRVSVDNVGALDMPRDGVMTFELTLLRLTPASGDPWRHQTNLAGFVASV